MFSKRNLKYTLEKGCTNNRFSGRGELMNQHGFYESTCGLYKIHRNFTIIHVDYVFIHRYFQYPHGFSS